jgi:pumilio RNA-binding family
MSQHKYASNVVEKCLTHGSGADRDALVEEACTRMERCTIPSTMAIPTTTTTTTTHPPTHPPSRQDTEPDPSVPVPSASGIGHAIVPTPALLIMMRDQFANYVVQKMLDVAGEARRRDLVAHIRPHAAILRYAR